MICNMFASKLSISYGQRVYGYVTRIAHVVNSSQQIAVYTLYIAGRYL